MLVASDGALATPETGEQMLDKLPMGGPAVRWKASACAPRASRTCR
ncbi:hypothetical protein ACFSTD_05355 [Novosphingobium colocasiae]